MTPPGKPKAMELPWQDQARQDSPATGFPRRLLIRASAGTGKTFQLSSRYIALLRESSPDRILASTFTRKAAGEILERILLRLARAGTSRAALEELNHSICPPALSQGDCLQQLARLTRELHRVRISTLDAFFAQLASSYSLELGLPPGWRMLETLESEQLRALAVEQMLRDGAPQDLVQLMHMLDKGNSSRSVSSLISRTIDSMYGVFLSSDPKCWESFPHHQLLAAGAREELLAMIEAVPLDKASLSTARAKDCENARQGDWESVLGKGLLPPILSGQMTYRRVPIPQALEYPYRRLGEHALAELVVPWKQQTLAARQVLQDFHTAYDQLKRGAGGLEFQDVTRKLAQGELQTLAASASFRMDAAIEHLLLDEFQDTSPDQWRVIQPFALHACDGPRRSFFCVGDTKQAIYGWRGGEAAIFDTIEQQLPGLALQPLNRSYRSAPAVIDAVNLAMTQLRHHDNLEDQAELLNHWCQTFPKHETSKTGLSGYVRLMTTSQSAEPEEGAPAKQVGKDKHWKDTAQYIRELAEQSPGASIGVLTRKNETVGRLIFELSLLGVPASEEGGNPLTDSAAVQLVMSLMLLADHPGHTVAAFHVAQSPLGTLLGFAKFDQPEDVARFSSALRNRLLSEGFGGVVHSIARQLAPACDRREQRRLAQLAGLADRFDVLQPTLRPSDFVEFVQKQRCEEPSQAPVRVMNIHQSKGLEFDIVVLPELDVPLIRTPPYVSRCIRPGSPPDLVALYRNETIFSSLGGDLLEARHQTRARMLQESLCLLYVAMTRAIRSLHLLIPPKPHARQPQTFAGLLLAGLARQVPLVPETVLWEHGQADWNKEFRRKGLEKSSPAGTEEPAAPFRIEMAPSKGNRNRKRSTASGDKQRRPLPLSVILAHQWNSAASEGTLFHRWLQDILWLEDELPSIESLMDRGQGLGFDSARLETLAAGFRILLQSPALSSLLSQNRGPQSSWAVLSRKIPGLDPASVDLSVRTEFPFACEASGELINGCIDRIVLCWKEGVPVAADIVDFKSDELPQESRAVADRVEYYRGQMLAYRQAVARLFTIPAENVIIRIAFLKIDHVAIVDASA
jgi:ATP-dependent exoDNAse (exonuclease V) beta subunit